MILQDVLQKQSSIFDAPFAYWEEVSLKSEQKAQILPLFL